MICLFLFHNVFVALVLASVLACGWHLSHCPGWNPWHWAREKTWIEQAPCWCWVGGPKICRMKKIHYTILFWNGGKQHSFSTIAGWAKVVWNDMCSTAAFLTLVMKPEECGDSVSGFSFLYTLWGSDSDQRDPPPFPLCLSPSADSAVFLQWPIIWFCLL